MADSEVKIQSKSKLKLLDQIRNVLRTKHYSTRTKVNL